MKLYSSICIYFSSDCLVYYYKDTSVASRQKYLLYVKAKTWGHFPSKDLLPLFPPSCQHLWLWTVFLDISNRNSSSSFIEQWCVLQLANKSMSTSLSNSLAILSVWVWDMARKSPSPGKRVGWGVPNKIAHSQRSPSWEHRPSLTVPGCPAIWRGLLSLDHEGHCLYTVACHGHAGLQALVSWLACLERRKGRIYTYFRKKKQNRSLLISIILEIWFMPISWWLIAFPV